MKSCRLQTMKSKTMVLQLEGPRPCATVCFNVHIKAGQLLQHISNIYIFFLAHFIHKFKTTPLQYSKQRKRNKK